MIPHFNWMWQYAATTHTHVVIIHSNGGGRRANEPIRIIQVSGTVPVHMHAICRHNPSVIYAHTFYTYNHYLELYPHISEWIGMPRALQFGYFFKYIVLSSSVSWCIRLKESKQISIEWMNEWKKERKEESENQNDQNIYLIIIIIIIISKVTFFLHSSSQFKCAWNVSRWEP